MSSQCECVWCNESGTEARVTARLSDGRRVVYHMTCFQEMTAYYESEAPTLDSEPVDEDPQ